MLTRFCRTVINSVFPIRSTKDFENRTLVVGAERGENLTSRIVLANQSLPKSFVLLASFTRGSGQKTCQACIHQELTTPSLENSCLRNATKTMFSGESIPSSQGDSRQLLFKKTSFRKVSFPILKSFPGIYLSVLKLPYMNVNVLFTAHFLLTTFAQSEK